MNPTGLRQRIVADRAAWIRRMLARLRSLPLASWEEFQSDQRNVAAAESYLRRALEALLDLGRHMLAKGFGEGVTEYKEIATRLVERGVLDRSQSLCLQQLAGYRNRLVHFYHEVSERELYEICRDQLGDVERVLNALLDWLAAHPELVDRTL